MVTIYYILYNRQTFDFFCYPRMVWSLKDYKTFHNLNYISKSQQMIKEKQIDPPIFLSYFIVSWIIGLYQYFCHDMSHFIITSLHLQDMALVHCMNERGFPFMENTKVSRASQTHSDLTCGVSK